MLPHVYIFLAGGTKPPYLILGADHTLLKQDLQKMDTDDPVELYASGISDTLILGKSQ